jgi:hypothetical protein
MLVGDIHMWSLNGTTRRYTVVTLPYELASKLFKANVYDAKTGEGEQRKEIATHVKALKRDMLAGQFTPTPVSAGCRPKHLTSVVFNKYQVHLDLDEADPLPLTDGQQRFGALRAIVEEAKKDENADLLKKVLGLPITVTIHFDSKPAVDFLRLQLGRPVDTAHLLSLKVKEGLVPDKDSSPLKLAMAVAKFMHGSSSSPFHKMVKFDTRGMSNLPVTTLCARGASDLSVSLMGLVKVGAKAGIETPEELSDFVTQVVKTLNERAPYLLDTGMPLCPPPDGTRGSATMLIGLATCLAYRVYEKGNGKVEEEDLAKLVEVAEEVFETPVSGNFSSAFKRDLMKAFATRFFSDLVGPQHEGIPVELLKTLSCSSFRVSRLPKERTATRGRAATSRAPRASAKLASPTVAEPPKPSKAAAVIPAQKPAPQPPAEVMVAPPPLVNKVHVGGADLPETSRPPEVASSPKITGPATAVENSKGSGVVKLQSLGEFIPVVDSDNGSEAPIVASCGMNAGPAGKQDMVTGASATVTIQEGSSQYPDVDPWDAA